MSDQAEEKKALDAVDLSIIFSDLGPENLATRHHRPEKGFWHTAFSDAQMSLSGRKPPKKSCFDTPICPDYRTFSDHIFECHQMELESAAEPTQQERPNEVDDQVVECTPQFILRNIPKIERYYDLDRPLNFDMEDLPIAEANEMLQEMRNAHIGNIEFIDVQSVNFVNDFRDFLEEIFTLCPWDQITTKGELSEDNPWHIKNSTSKLTADLLSKKNTLFIFSEKGMTQVGMKAYKPKQNKDDSDNPLPPGVHGFGPG